MLRVAEQQDPVLRDEALGSRAAWNQRQWSLLLHLRAMQLTRAVQGQWQSEANHRLLAQFESSGVGPSWDPDELHWCPVFPTTLQCKEPNTVKQLHALADATSDLFLSQLDAMAHCLAAAAGAACRSQSVMVIGSHAGLLADLLAKEGPSQLHVLEQGPLQASLAKKVLPHNVLDTPLHALSPGAFTADLLVVSGLLDNRLLRSGVLHAVRLARPVAHPSTRVWPPTLTMRVQLLDMHVRTVARFDLSAVNAYRWYPGAEPLDDLARVQHTALSAPFTLLDLTLGDWLHSDPGTLNTLVDAAVLQAGCCNAVALWWDAAGVSGRHMRGGVAVWYLPPRHVHSGDVLTVNVKVDSALSLSWEDAQHAPPPRCSTWLPRWHFDMLADAQVLIGPSLQYHAPHTTQRARAYDTAITRAVTDMRAAGNRAVVLDAGAGTGLLAMMAARHASMAATAVWCVAANELSAAVTVLHADVRHLTLDAPSINGGLPISQRLPEPITVVVYELFDAGLLGEGILPVLAHVHEHLCAAAPPRLVPRGAQVYCQLLQYEDGGHAAQHTTQHTQVLTGDGAYEAVDLRQARQCTYLTNPFPVLAFDFAQWRANLKPASHSAQVPITRPGVCNAIGMFFDVHLDRTTRCTSSPHASNASWPQALFRVPQPTPVQPRSIATVTARHDATSVHVRLVGVDASREKSRVAAPDSVAREWVATKTRCDAVVQSFGAGDDPHQARQLVAAAFEAVETGPTRPGAWAGGAAQAAVLAARLCS